jgi:hypothetical protein
MTHFTIHIFGYGDTQINGDEFSVKAKTDTLTKVQPLVSAIWALKPADSDAEQQCHAINIFNYENIVYMSKNGFNVKTTPELKTLIDELISELKTNPEAKANREDADAVKP